jgi:hypothetical protein
MMPRVSRWIMKASPAVERVPFAIFSFCSWKKAEKLGP